MLLQHRVLFTPEMTGTRPPDLPAVSFAFAVTAAAALGCRYLLELLLPAWPGHLSRDAKHLVASGCWEPAVTGL